MTAERPTRDLILDAAEPLFAAQGFARTTIKQIGDAAGVNTALLYYYFGDKETLYRETLRRRLGAFAEGGLRRMDPAAPPAANVRRLVETQVEIMTHHPHLPRLLLRELVDHDASFAEEQITHLAATLFRRLCDVIEQGQRDGAFRRELDPRFAAISTVAQVAYLFVARPAIGILLGYGTAGPPPETVRAFGRHAADFALAALADPAPATLAAARRRARQRRRAR